MATFDLFRNKRFFINGSLDRTDTLNSPFWVCITQGAITSILLILTFLSIENYKGVAELGEMAVLYLILLLIGIFIGMMRIRSAGTNQSMTYFQGIVCGLVITILSSVLFSTYIFIYLSHDPAAFEHLKERLAYGHSITLFSVCLGVLFEVIAMGVIATFGVMQYFKEY